MRRCTGRREVLLIQTKEWKECIDLLCRIFYTWKHNRKPLLHRGRMSGCRSSLGIAVRMEGRQMQIWTFPSPFTSLALVVSANQVDVAVKESLKWKTESWSHSLRVVYGVCKGREAAFFNWPCAGELLEWTSGFLNTSYGSHLLSVPLASSVNHSPIPSLCSTL